MKPPKYRLVSKVPQWDGDSTWVVVLEAGRAEAVAAFFDPKMAEEYRDWLNHKLELERGGGEDSGE